MQFNDRRLVDMQPTRGTVSHYRAQQLADPYTTGSAAMATFRSTGAIRQDLTNEIQRRVPQATTRKDARGLDQLGRYVNKSGVRGPQRGWSDLTAPAKPGYQMPSNVTAALRAAEQEITRKQSKKN